MKLFEILKVKKKKRIPARSSLFCMWVFVKCTGIPPFKIEKGML